MSIAELLTNITVASDFLPVAAALYNYRRLDPILRLMAVFCMLSVIPDVVGLVISYLQLRHYNNLFLFHLFDMMAAIFFTLIYHRAFYKSLFKKMTLIFGITSVAAMIFNVIFVESIWSYPSVSNTLLSVLLIILSLVYFYQLLSRQEFTYIEKQGMFWINSGVLFYYAITIFLFMLYKKINDADRSNYYMMQSVMNIIANLLYSIGLLCKPQNQKTT
ncbi:hypothetical protein [Mucilaginibacter sp. BT774]|uniref:hypothetical protein n=1 Tax=Mucilaginibacter sp. BT774 TaxID=3062276 RepID=UPI002674E6E4|nr:hypothetical protein [Mucilaginibacter sp. BT774]MDO3626544.1 hypothetical protein [Mucilaginibacter sp. BT774]